MGGLGLARTRAAPPLTFVRSRGVGRAMVVLVSTALLGLLVPASPVPVRFRLASVGLAPLVAALPGVFLPTLLERPERVLEPTRSWRLVMSRLIWLTLLLALGTLVGEVAVGGPGAWQQSGRSMLLTGGLGLLAGELVPAVGAWLPGALLTVVTFIYGTATMSGRPYAWALLLQPITSARAAQTGLALFGVGAVLYVARDARSSA
jgi:hypothetical protein